MFNLDQKVIVVVGGRGYLGRDFCYYLKKQNGIVISADLKESSMASLKSKKKKDQSNILQVDINVTKEKDAKTCFLLGKISTRRGERRNRCRALSCVTTDVTR